MDKREVRELMQKLVTGMSVNRGFTLIEILIVIVIIGITVGFALISFGDFGESRRIQFSAEQFINTLKLAQQQAILNNSTLGLTVNNTSYRILQFKPPTQWNAISDKGIFKTQYFPNNTIIKLKTNSNSTVGTPAILIHASGDMTPFVLQFGSNKESTVTTIIGRQDGMLSFENTKAP